jgi:hypothetical protein
MCACVYMYVTVGVCEHVCVAACVCVCKRACLFQLLVCVNSCCTYTYINCIYTHTTHCTRRWLGSESTAPFSVTVWCSQPHAAALARRYVSVCV